jgi:serine protein kinase
MKQELQTQLCRKQKLLMEQQNSVSSSLMQYAQLYDRKEFMALHEEMSFSDYVEQLKSKPTLARNSFQYIYDMIISKGVTAFERYRKSYNRYNFFNDQEIPIFGLEETLQQLVDFIQGAAGGYGTEHRVLLLHGPVGSSKSTICRLIKRGLEKYSRTPEGAWYSYKWVNLPCEGINAMYTEDTCMSPMNENPLKLMPMSMRNVFLKELNDIFSKQHNGDSPYELISEGDLNPRCKFFMSELLRRYNGDWFKVVTEHIRVVRRVHSEIDRVGIGTFQPKDEKNQDSTELTGDMNFAKIGHFGADSDSRAFNFDGEFEVGNRGMVEFIEMLKLTNEFLYDLLGASQEHQIKPKKFSQIVIDELIVSHTNGAEFQRLKSNQFMEALRDRTIKIDVPYLLRWSDEIKVLEQDYGPTKIKQHMMPHTLEIAALFAVLTRLYDDPDKKLDLRDKAKLYDGRALPGWTEDSVKELRDKYTTEGMDTGVSARYVQDKLSNCLARHKSYVNVFHVMSELKAGLSASSLITNVEDIKRYEYCAELAIKELNEILKNEVQKALVADEKAIERLCNKYIDNVIAYVNEEKMINPITGEKMDPDERLMRSIEEKNNIPEQGCDDFRRSLSSFIGTLARRKQEFSWDSNPELQRALQAKMFEDVRSTIKLSSLTREASEVDPDLQEKLEAVKTRLIKNYGYNQQSATDVLDYCSSLFATGDVAEN